MSIKKLLYNLFAPADDTFMKRPKKKTPSDYPQMAFRVSPEDKAGLSELIDEVHELANTNVAEDERRVKKNELIVDALWLGLQTIKKKFRRL